MAGDGVADTHKYTLFGGSRGGQILLVALVFDSLFVAQAARGLRGGGSCWGCENYPALDDRHLSKIQIEFPPSAGAFGHRARRSFGYTLSMAAVCWRCATLTTQVSER